MCTLEIPQKFAAQILAHNLLLFLLLGFLLKLRAILIENPAHFAPFAPHENLSGILMTFTLIL